tara:strand:- start:1850 stop:2098 length:249 start_codon:yes stop_codon:yes gene_type:complete
VIALEKISLANVGGHMGMQSTPTLFRKYFSSARLARLYAEKDNGSKIDWKEQGTNSGDLRTHQYLLVTITLEDSNATPTHHQ